tara:strand:- start:9589 stop:11613 length:2025 start_codon:yes stop_codon:yes gene_type:complete
MLSYKEYRRLKQNNGDQQGLVFEDIDNVFDSWTSEVTGLIVSPKNTEKLIEFCEAAVASDSKWKTIQEHRMIKQLPFIIGQTLEEECAQARLFIGEAKYQIKMILKEATVDPWAQLQNRNAQAASDIEKEVEDIFLQLKTDLLNQYGVNRGQQPSAPSSAPGPSDPVQKPGIWQRAKNWIKGMWQGATGGDPNLRKFALSKGYAQDPKYQHDPHAWKDRQKHPEFFPQEEFAGLTNLLKEDFDEAKAAFEGIFTKHKDALLKLIARFALQTFVNEPTDRATGDAEPETTVKGDEPVKPTLADEPEDEPDSEKDRIFDPDVDDWEAAVRSTPPGDLGKVSPKTQEPQETPNKELLNTRSFRVPALAASIQAKQADGTITLVNAKGDTYTFTPEQQSETSKHKVFENDTHKIKITKTAWGLAERHESAESKSKPPETESKPPETEDDGSPTAGAEELARTPDEPNDERDYDDGIHADDDSEVGDKSDIAAQAGMGDYDPFADQGDDDANDAAAQWLKSQAVGDDEPTKDQDVPTSEPESTEDTPKIKSKKEEVELSPEQIVDKAVNPKAFSAANLKNTKFEDGKLKFTSRGEVHDLGVFHDPDDNLVYLFFKQKSGKYNVKHMPKEKYDDLTGANDADAPVATKVAAKKSTEKTPAPNKFTGQQMGDHGQSVLDSL